MEAEGLPLVESLELKRDEPSRIAPPAPCVTFSGSRFGLDIHLVCNGELAACCISMHLLWHKSFNLGVAHMECWQGNHVCAAVTAEPAFLWQGSAQCTAWTMLARCLQRSPHTLLSRRVPADIWGCLHCCSALNSQTTA